MESIEKIEYGAIIWIVTFVALFNLIRGLALFELSLSKCVLDIFPFFFLVIIVYSACFLQLSEYKFCLRVQFFFYKFGVFVLHLP